MCAGGSLSTMIDNRFPFLKRLDEAPIPRGFLADCKDIARRAEAKVVWNSAKRSVYFYLRDPSVGVFSIRHDRRPGASDVDDIVRYIRLGRMDIERKRAIEARREKEEETQKQAAFDRHFDERAGDAEDYGDWLHRRRCGVDKLISA